MDFDKIIMICRTYGVTISFTYEKFPDSLKLRLYYLPTRMGSSVSIPMAKLCKSIYPHDVVLHQIKECIIGIIGRVVFEEIPFDWEI